MADTPHSPATNSPGLFAKVGAFVGAPDALIKMGVGAVAMAAILLPLTCKEVKPGKTLVFRHTDTTYYERRDTMRSVLSRYVFAHDTVFSVNNVLLDARGDSLTVSSIAQHDTLRVVQKDSIVQHDTLEYKLPQALRVRGYVDASAGLFGPPTRLGAGVAFTILEKYEPYAQVEYQSTTKSGIRAGLRIYF